eukprot:TRINITY_DN6642_c0_g1_i1.p1 TRINITY_DN6642_c0_g1~~TRINITY_DN6642_c0_g1_i1.p1  ORF type:complete len:314 (-),score=42.11 TRINITY_DN6642_c0_g1_i1:175-1116(-)
MDNRRKRRWVRMRVWKGLPGKCGDHTTNDRGRVIEILIQGWLLKHYQKILLSNSLRYFALIAGDTELRYYEDDPNEKEVDPKGIIPLNHIIKFGTYADLKSSHRYGFTLHTLRRSYQLGCTTAEDRDAWITVITQNFDSNMEHWGAIHINIRDFLSYHIDKHHKNPEIQCQGTLRIRGTQANWRKRVFVLVSPGYIFLFKDSAVSKQFTSITITKKNYSTVEFIRGLSSLASECCAVTEVPRDMKCMNKYKGEDFVMTIKMSNSRRFYFAYDTDLLRSQVLESIKSALAKPQKKDRSTLGVLFSRMMRSDDKR